MICVDAATSQEMRQVLAQALDELKGSYDPASPNARAWDAELVTRVKWLRPELHCFVLPVNGYVVVITPMPYQRTVLVNINDYYDNVPAEEPDDDTDR